jgi:hypothetical protein
MSQGTFGRCWAPQIPGVWPDSGLGCEQCQHNRRCCIMEGEITTG